ncbi:UNVERIFIED_ORG: putative small secreted protein [Microbispora rosea subsp. rosea]
MGMRATAVVCLALVATALITTGCASAEGTSVTSTAERFLSAAGEGRGGQACLLLAPEAARSLDDCEKQIVSVGLRSGAVRGVDVWGDEARVQVDGDTLFLHRFPDGWRVRAAGCEPRPDQSYTGQPYECEVNT